MNENLKTAVYVVVAALLGVVAWGTLPQEAEVDVSGLMVGKPLFDKFDDTSKAASLQIDWYDETLGTPKSFKVAKVAGQWVVPSHENYPADAETQLRDAASSLFQLKCLHVASEVADDHELFGVVEPPKDSSGTTKKGVGKLIILQDAKGDDLVRMVVGKEVDQSPGQRFVRIAESGNLTPQVYIAKIDLEKLPTEFGKWIERDLLKLNPNDVARLALKDYSILRKQNRYEVHLKMDSTISWDTLQGSWNLDSFQVYDDRNKPHDAALADGEELAKTRLDDLKNALDDLKIEGVARKPEGLGADLALDENLLGNQQIMSSLQEHGYFAGPRDGKLEIYSRNGEVSVDCKDGVRYTLRFGDVASVQEGAGLDKLNRFLLVSAQVAEDMIPKPVLEPEPQGPAPTEPAKEATPKPPAASGGACQEEEETKEADQKKEESPKADAAKTKSGEKAKAQPAKPKNDNAATDSKAKTGGKADVPAAPKAEPAIDPAQTKLELIRRENARKTKDYEESLKKAQGRAAALNARFARWYYVISEDTYKKIHLGRGDIIQEGATAKESGFGVDAFRKLESEGLKKTAPPTSGGSSGGFPGGGPGLPGSP